MNFYPIMFYKWVETLCFYDIFEMYSWCVVTFLLERKDMSDFSNYKFIVHSCTRMKKLSKVIKKIYLSAF